MYMVRSSRGVLDAHGDVLVGSPDSASIMRELGAEGHIVFLDTETTGLAGGTGTYAFMCGIGYEREGRFEVMQFFLEGPSRERAWLDAVMSAIPMPATIVTYNGQTFDLPLLRTRHILNRLEPSWDLCPHIDLLRTARRFYKGVLRSCSLSSIEQHILGVERSGEDIPGSLIPGLYAEYLRTRDASPLAGVFYHNEIDIVSLASLYCYIASILAGDRASGHELLRAGELWESLGHLDRAVEFWMRARSDGRCAAEAEALIGFARKREREYALSKDHFRAAFDMMRDSGAMTAGASTFFDICCELAKIEEHRMRSPERAMDYVRHAGAWLKKNRYILGEGYKEMMISLRHRHQRLERAMKNDKGDDQDE